ncbi:MAG TPA: P-loop NTPase, partial [candidate division Zixibacteria bacterium]|nr:P-loop NTPase [candidate division Zixibacteria bacterium]
NILDPELKAPIAQLGMLGGVVVSGSEVAVALKLPLPDSPSEAQLLKAVEDSLKGLSGVTRVEITTSVMSDEERMNLADRLHGRESAATGSGEKQLSETAIAAVAPLQLDANGEIAETNPERRQVAEALAQVNDPEINLPLTKLGMVAGLGVGDGDVALNILLTVPGCPLKNKIVSDVTASLKRHKWVRNVGVEFGVMTEQQRERVRDIVRSAGSGTPEGWKHEIKTGEYADRILVVCSGKGGVGKSTTTTNLAFALAAKGYKVGILDADVYGFSIPRMSGVHGQPNVDENRLEPVTKGNVQVVSMGYFIDEDKPVIWRGPMLHKAINQFLADVAWEKMDYLLIDLPPGTGDVTLTIAQALPKAEVLVVTTPQPVATHVAGRVAQLAERTHLKLLGVIENMSYLEINGEKQRIFGEGGGKLLAEKLGAPLLGEIPLQQEIRERCDEGEPITSDESRPGAAAYFAIVK